MSNALTFYLNGKYVYYQYYASDGRANGSTGLKVEPGAFKEGARTKEEAKELRRLQSVIDDYEKHHRPTTKADVDAVMAEATGRKQPTPKPTTDTFYLIFQRYRNAAISGEVLNKGKRFSASWIRTAGTVLNALSTLPIGALSPSDIGTAELTALDAAITGMGMNRRKASTVPKKYGAAQNTVSTYMAVIIGVLNKTRRLGWHKGPVLDTAGIRSTAEDIDHGQYLSEAEQVLISALPYKGEAAAWRDAFIAGCQLGMRYIDLSRVTPQHRQGDMVNINTVKTGKQVWVPLNTVAHGLWKKHKGQFIVPPHYQFMPFIRKAGQDAGIDKPVLFTRTEGGIKVEKWVKKWELLGTHTMRRSAATNMYLAGVPVPSIMGITGHKTYASFLKYIRLSGEEHARLMSEHEYFKR